MLPAHGERIPDVLIRTSSVSVKRDGKALNSDACHFHAFLSIDALKSSGDFSSCGFDSHPGHHFPRMKTNQLGRRVLPCTPRVPPAWEIRNVSRPHAFVRSASFFCLRLLAPLPLIRESFYLQ